jgi:hypothetical protein
MMTVREDDNDFDDDGLLIHHNHMVSDGPSDWRHV